MRLDEDHGTRSYPESDDLCRIVHQTASACGSSGSFKVRKQLLAAGGQSIVYEIWGRLDPQPKPTCPEPGPVRTR